MAPGLPRMPWQIMPSLRLLWPCAVDWRMPARSMEVLGTRTLTGLCEPTVAGSEEVLVSLSCEDIAEGMRLEEVKAGVCVARTTTAVL